MDMDINNFDKNAVIYTRFSSQSQDKQTTEVQLKACREYAENIGLNIIEEYTDEAYTGTNDKRPAFQKMLKDSDKGDFQFVIVYNYDRLARDTLLSLQTIKNLQSKGVTVLFTNETFNDNSIATPYDKLNRGINFIIAEFNSDLYSAKIKKGLENVASKYQATGGQRTLGFKTIDKQFTIVENEAIAVKRIFEMYADGESMAYIIEYMNNQGFKTSRNNPFNKNSIRKILLNKRYIGTYVFKDIEVPNKIPRIISDELFNEVQVKMGQNKKAPARKRAKTDYLLTTKLFCGHCKEMMTGNSGTSRNGTLHTYYKCKNTITKPKSCDKKPIPKDYIEDLVVENIRKFLTDKNIERIANNVVKLYHKQQDMYIIKRLQNAITMNKNKLDNLVTSLSETNVDSVRKLVFDKITDLEKETKGLERELAKEKTKLLNITVDNITYFLTDLRNGYINNIRYRKTLINALINRIYLYDENMIIALNTQNESVEIDLPMLLDMENVLIKGDMLHQK